MEFVRTSVQHFLLLNFRMLLKLHYLNVVFSKRKAARASGLP